MRKGFVSMSSSPMFDFVTVKPCPNPLGGACLYHCKYCWAWKLAKRNNMKKYEGEPRLYESVLKRRFKRGDFVFVQDMTDLMAYPTEMLYKVFEWFKQSPDATFLTLTKNPNRYLFFLDFIPSNTILGATIESNLPYPELSGAPFQSERLMAMDRLARICEPTGVYDFRLFVSMEPILDFTPALPIFLRNIKPWAVALGYDNYGNDLPEPSPEKFEKLVKDLDKFTKVYLKTIPGSLNLVLSKKEEG